MHTWDRLSCISREATLVKLSNLSITESVNEHPKIPVEKGNYLMARQVPQVTAGLVISGQSLDSRAPV